LARLARAVRDGRVKDSIFIEGLRLCEEAASAGVEIEALIYTERIALDERASKLIQRVKPLAQRTAVVSQQVFGSISDTRTPQGIAFLATRPDTSEHALTLNRAQIDGAAPSEVATSPLFIVLHGINNPTNLGAILRTGEAAGASGALITEGTADPFSPKALRGAMGSSFRIPLWTGMSFSEALAWCTRNGIRTVAADARSTCSYVDLDWSGPCALVLGPEASGLTTGEKAAVDSTVMIPMRETVESLNVAVAGAVLLYEAARQRREKNPFE
jgi:TrmH family RNA methyltransferase